MTRHWRVWPALLLLLTGLSACSESGAPGSSALLDEDAAFATRWPILLSHPWSNTADSSFHGDTMTGPDSFEPYGIKRLLEAGGAAVYQPDKLAYASHETRGRLLYRACEGVTVAQRLCESGDTEPVDGVDLAIADYCSNAGHRERSGFSDEDSCRQGLQFNIICHSQGCPDSRYMMVAVDNAYSGLPMYRHVASWTSLAGANKGTSLADWALQISAGCLLPGCRAAALGVVFGLDGLWQNGVLALQDATDSLVALSRHYMLHSTDMSCRPQDGMDCPPSFNQRYPLPEDPDHPIRYVTYSKQIDDISHPCYDGIRLFWQVVEARDGVNDGYISVESQAYTTNGANDSGGATPVIARILEGSSSDPATPHPGLEHMAVSNAATPGIDGVSCAGEDNSALHFSREAVYRDTVSELLMLGY